MKRVLEIIAVIIFTISVVGQDTGYVFRLLDGSSIGLTDLAQNRWAVAFAAVPGCQACEEMIRWYGHAATAFPEIRCLLVVPEATPELTHLLELWAPSVDVLVDPNNILKAPLEVRSIPAVLLSVDGVYVRELTGLFTEVQLLRSMAESLVVEVHFPDAGDLVGQSPPDFSFADEDGASHLLSEVSRPLLLAFLDPRCSPCMSLPITRQDVGPSITVGLVVAMQDLTLSDVQLKTLNQLSISLGPKVIVMSVGTDVLRTYKVARSPTYFLIDKKGVMRWVLDGILEKASVSEAVRSALGKD